MLINLSPNSFFRDYGKVGYLYHQKNRKDAVLDEIATLFLSHFTRIPTAADELLSSIAERFPDVEADNIKADFMELVHEMNQDGFIEIAESDDEFLNRSDGCGRDSFAEGAITHNHSETEYLPSSEFLQQYFAENPQLFSMQIELTSHCNLNCIHCYLGEDHPKDGMSTEKLFEILDELGRMGVLKVTFTGGEAVLHPRFMEIIERARLNDLCIAVLSNGTLFSDAVIECLVRNQVGLVQISLYSLDARVHDAITKHPFSHAQTMKNIQKLIKANVTVQIACPVMKENLDSIADLIDWGNQNGVRVNHDVLIKARSSFERDNLEHRLELSGVESAIRTIVERDPIYQKQLRDKGLVGAVIDSDGPVCGIGTSSLCLAYDGRYYPCPGMQLTVGDATTSTISEVWTQSRKLHELRRLKKSSYEKCVGCESISYCMLCPAKFYNESGGDMLEISDHFCAVSHANKKIAEDYICNTSGAIPPHVS